MKNKEKQLEVGTLLRKLDRKDMVLITTVIYIATVIIFELLYCNYEFVTKSITQYNLSIYRFIAYIAVYCVFYKFKDKFIEPALAGFKSKFKCFFVDIVLILTVIIATSGLIILFLRQSITIKSIIFFIALLNINLFTLYFSNNIVKNAVVTAVLLGSIFSISITFNNQLDEKRHFLASYSISIGKFNLKEPNIDESIVEMPRNLTPRGFVQYYKKYPSGDINNNIEKFDIKDTPNDYITITYLISGLGIFIARILGGSIADIYLTGRLFNLIGFIFIIIQAIKILPYKKQILYAIFFMPMLLALSSVYSVDGIGTATTALFIAYCLKLKSKENIEAKELTILIILTMLAATIKSVGYIGIALALFILPLRKIIKQNKKYIKYIALLFIIITISVIIVYAIRINEPGDPRTQGTDTLKQFEFIARNPLEYCKILLMHLVRTFSTLKGLSFLNAPMFFNRTYYYSFIVLFTYILFISITDSSKHLERRTRLVFMMTFLAVVAMTSTAMYLSYTKVGSKYINGFQMRYMFPVLFLLLSSISIKKIELSNKFKYSELIAGYISSIFIIISIIDVIL